MSITKAEAEEFRLLFNKLADSLTVSAMSFFHNFKKEHLLKIIERETESELVETTPWAEVAADALRSGEYLQAIYLIKENLNHNEESKLFGKILSAWSQVTHMADRACLQPTRPGSPPLYDGPSYRCAKSAKGDVTYMCFTCWARHIVYGLYCEKCNTNHSSESC